ncbi:MAG: cytochrome c maturation protein CcmE [Pseudomonadota bacterium]
MNPARKQRLYIAVFVLVVGVAATSAIMLALDEDLNMFYPPAKVVGGAAPVGVPIRAGGMVLEDSVRRAPDSLAVRFTLTDRATAQYDVLYEGILPDLFREGQGIVVEGRLGADGVFQASTVLAKHDENYMPPELAGMQAADAGSETDLPAGASP